MKASEYFRRLGQSDRDRKHFSRFHYFNNVFPNWVLWAYLKGRDGL